MSIEEEERVAKAGVFDAGRNAKRPERQALGSVMEAPREVPIFATTDVLIVGGGPAGTTAAIAAARIGADVILAERYNHLGGLSTGGLVCWIDRMSDWDGKHVIKGLFGEFIALFLETSLQY